MSITRDTKGNYMNSHVIHFWVMDVAILSSVMNCLPIPSVSQVFGRCRGEGLLLSSFVGKTEMQLFVLQLKKSFRRSITN